MPSREGKKSSRGDQKEMDDKVKSGIKRLSEVRGSVASRLHHRMVDLEELIPLGDIQTLLEEHDYGANGGDEFREVILAVTVSDPEKAGEWLRLISSPSSNVLPYVRRNHAVGFLLGALDAAVFLASNDYYSKDLDFGAIFAGFLMSDSLVEVDNEELGGSQDQKALGQKISQSSQAILSVVAKDRALAGDMSKILRDCAALVPGQSPLSEMFLEDMCHKITSRMSLAAKCTSLSLEVTYMFLDEALSASDEQKKDAE